MNSSEWYAKLQKLANGIGQSVADRDAWLECFERGESPEKALVDEFQSDIEASPHFVDWLAALRATGSNQGFHDIVVGDVLEDYVGGLLPHECFNKNYHVDHQEPPAFKDWMINVREIGERNGALNINENACIDDFSAGLTPSQCFNKNWHVPNAVDAPVQFVTKEGIAAKIKNVSYHVFEGTTLTHCIITLENGFTVTGESACVRPENFDRITGETWAYKDAFEKIWKLEDYLLKQQLHEWNEGETNAMRSSSNIKRDNSVVLSEMVLAQDKMSSGIVGEHKTPAEREEHWVKLVAFANEIIAVNQTNETLQP